MKSKINTVIKNELTTYDAIDINEAKFYISKVESALAGVIEAIPNFNLVTHVIDNLYNILVEAIVYQQLTSYAANSIYKKLCNIFSCKTISPLDIIRAEDAELRYAGLSKNKIVALRSLSEFAISGKLPDNEELKLMTNEEIISRLTQIKGIGKWTVEMILIFTIGRVDVVSSGDYSLRKGLAIISGTMPIIPSPKDFEEHAKIWAPYRSIAAWYLWRVVDLYNKKENYFKQNN